MELDAHLLQESVQFHEQPERSNTHEWFTLSEILVKKMQENSGGPEYSVDVRVKANYMSPFSTR